MAKVYHLKIKEVIKWLKKFLYLNMHKNILFATTNPYKKQRFQAYFAPLGLRVLSFSDFDKTPKIVEDGKTPEDNALKKAFAGYKTFKVPSFGVDYWLRIEGLQESLQPDQFVRRIIVKKDGQRKDATDKELLNYYADLIKNLGGKTRGIWTSAIALVINPRKKYKKSFTRDTLFTSSRSTKITPGEPLNSIQIDPITGKYLSEFTKKEWLKREEGRKEDYIEFMKSHLRDML